MKGHKHKLSRKNVVESVTLRYYLIISILTYIVFLFPKLFGAKFFTAVDMFVFIFKTGNNLLSPLSLLIFFCVVLILNTIAIIAIFKSYRKRDISWPHWVYFSNIFLILFFGVFMMNYFIGLEGGLPNNLLSKWMGYSFWAYQILGYGFALSLVILTIWSYIFMGKKEFRKQTEKEGLGKIVPKDLKSDTLYYVIYLVAFLIGVAIGGAIPLIIALLIAYLIIWILKRKRAGRKNKSKMRQK